MHAKRIRQKEPRGRTGDCTGRSILTQPGNSERSTEYRKEIEGECGLKKEKNTRRVAMGHAQAEEKTQNATFRQRQPGS